MEQINEIEFRKHIDILHPNNGLFEIRVLDGKKTYSGYFTDSGVAYEAVKPFVDKAVYVTFNTIDECCYSRSQRDCMKQNPKAMTSDNDITMRKWVLLDFDPKRASDTNSTDGEAQKAREVANNVFAYLRDIGFTASLCLFSGNGVHITIPCEMENTPENTELIKTFLNAINILFGTAEVDCDCSVYNASRITKVGGTYSRKGSNKDKLRPQRQCEIKRIPDVIKPTPKVLFQKVSDVLPKPEKPTYQNNYNKDKFDIDSFLSKHGINVTQRISFAGGTKYILDNCLFNSNHKGKDAAIFVLDSGAIGYKCFHSSCSNYKWHDVRKKFEPNAYDKNYNNFTKSRDTRPQNRTAIADTQPQVEDNEKGDKWLQLHNIKTVDRSKIISIPSGFTGLDKKIIGFNKGEVSVWSGINSSGKSSILNVISLNAIQRGFKVALWSGELTDIRVKNWIGLQAAGRQYTKPTSYENVYYVPPFTQEKIDEWLKDKFYVYNNRYGSKFETLLADVKEKIKQSNIDMIIWDNIMGLDMGSLQGDKYSKQSEMILEICNFVKEYNIHLHIVMHPRKSLGFLRKTDIAGTADLTNAVDNVFIAHRVNRDFERLAKDFFGDAYANEFMSFGNVIEVAKNRDLGVVDHLVGLYYEVESKRFLNDAYENIVYSWQDKNGSKYNNENVNFIDEEAISIFADFDESGLDDVF